MLKSIMRVSGDVDITETIKAIEAVSKVKVESYKMAWGLYILELDHDPDPTCPKCGKKIHAYGHGLCLNCWNILKKEIGAIS